MVYVTVEKIEVLFPMQLFNMKHLPTMTNSARLFALANEVLPTLPTTLFNIVHFDSDLPHMLYMLRREFIDGKLEDCEHRFPYIYLDHAYEMTNNEALKPLLEYFKPTKRCLREAWCAFSHARFHCPEGLPTDILEQYGFSSLEEVDSVIENAFIHRQKEDGLECLPDVRGYIKHAKTICDHILDNLPVELHRAPYMYLRRYVYNPLLFYIDYVLREDAIKRFREMFYALKYKQCFRRLLWEKVREPKIRAKYHPDNLANMLEERGELGVDELDALIDQW
jgi:hypothetical protein